MNKIKKSLILYYNSFKRSFDLNGKPTDGEFGNFIAISAIILIGLSLGLFPWYDETLIDFYEKTFIVPLFLGTSLFVCYLTFAMFPLVGIISRRFHQAELDYKCIATTLNMATQKVFLLPILFVLFCIIFSLLSSRSIDSVNIIAAVFIQYSIAILYAVINAIPMYLALIILALWLFILRNMDNLKIRLLKFAQKREMRAKLPFMKRFWWIKYLVIYLGLIVLMVTFDLTRYTPFAALAALCFILGVGIILYLFVRVFLSFSLLILFFLSIGACLLQVSPSLRFIIYVVAIIGAILYFEQYFSKKHSQFIVVFLPIALICFGLPLQGWRVSFNILGQTNYVEQKPESIGDKQLNALTIPLLKAATAQNPQKNILISAHNVYQGLGILANGATGQMLEKLKAILGSDSLEQINAKSRDVIEHHSSALKFKNKIEVAQQHLDKNFKKAIDENYSISFDSARDACSIAQTSVITFASTWKTQFDTVSMKTFHAPHGDIKVPMMQSMREVYIANGSNFRVIALPYKSGDIFYIILPDSEESLNGYGALMHENNAKTITLDEVLQSLSAEALDIPFEKHIIDIAIPLFEVEQNVNFQNIFNRLGLGNLFVRGQSGLDNILSPNAVKDTTTLCEPQNIHIQDFTQKNKIKVDEKGTVAVSVQLDFIMYATGGYISLPFIVNRPFIFMINNGAFAGIIYNPLEK